MPVSKHTQELDAVKSLSPNSRERRKAEERCIECGEPAERLRCPTCQQRGRDSQKRSKDKRKQEGMCVTCGGPKDDRYVKCSKCRAEQTVANKKSTAKKITNGLCLACGKPAENGFRRCSECNIRTNAKERKRRAKHTAEGKCRECGEEAQLSNKTLRGKERGNYCKDCWFKVLAGYTLGSRKLWRVLIEKLDVCGWRCPYSGEPLVLGDNLSFDHMDPVARFPEKKFDPDNIEPISWQVNLAKRDMTKAEFLAMVGRIHAYTKKE